ncbi:uncharacterized protein LOC119613257 isoform X7 [Lucilia sericata]|uniref:uncharacterized protein LOC119613257 isoform X7 n=1 Tax=Lucilia sericata TaxID=13632 RepID=UPI0018A84128|nr:uncharacterized protein LOC119613257 isoform X7 [Lucilia sericata]
MSQINCLPRPAFWKVPDYINIMDDHKNVYDLPIQTTQQQQFISPTPRKSSLTLCRDSRPQNEKIKKRVRFKDVVDNEHHQQQHQQQQLHYYNNSSTNNVQVGSPAFGEVLRGDIISKIRDYDARDVSHADAQMLFRTAGNEINLVVHRDSKIAYTQGLSGDSSRSESALLSTSPEQYPHRAPSPFLPGPGQYERALQVPVDTLPHTVFPKLNASGGYVPPPENSTFTPMPTRDHQQDVAEEQAAIVNQPYRTTPLVLPGAKVKKDAPTTESYLRHYPNPAVRAHPHHDFHDSVMKQRVADTMLHRVVGQDADSGKVFHKQFNSPIGLYSDNNIESTIRQTVPNQYNNQRPFPVRRTMW